MNDGATGAHFDTIYKPQMLQTTQNCLRIRFGADRKVLLEICVALLAGVVIGYLLSSSGWLNGEPFIEGSGGNSSSPESGGGGFQLPGRWGGFQPREEVIA